MQKTLTASAHGFLPGNSGDENRVALQKLFDIGGHIVVDVAGKYDLCGTAYIGSDTTLEFAGGAVIRRVPSGGGDGAAIMNKGAEARKYDENITIKGMTLECGGVDITREHENIVGAHAHVVFFYTKHTRIENFTCLDLEPHGFCIQICTFEDSLVENVHIEGMKDAVHYGPGRDFVLRNGVFRTFDDPVALNANDYAIANPEMGWIENGLIENCVDLDQPETTGFFCRLLGGSWCDWREGMIIRNSDTVVSHGRMYRAKMPPDGKEYISQTPPTHERGTAVIDGITWVMTQAQNVTYNCGCRNITFRNISLEKNRPTAFCFHFDEDVFSHSYYPYSNAPLQTGIVLENIKMKANVPFLVRATTPVGKLDVINSDIKDSKLRFADRGVPGIKYPPVELTVEGCKITGESFVSAVEGRKVMLAARDNDGELITVGDVESV